MSQGSRGPFALSTNFHRVSFSPIGVERVATLGDLMRQFIQTQEDVFGDGLLSLNADATMQSLCIVSWPVWQQLFVPP